jgi:dynein heavy chain
MIKAGSDAKNVVFMIADNQIGDRTYIYEDLNNMLNISDIPNLFTQEEFIPELEKLKEMAKREQIEEAVHWGFIEFYDYFIEKIKQHLHIVIYMSPVGKSLRMKIT